MESTEYTSIVQKIVDTLQTKYRNNSVEKECILLGLITRLEIITDKETGQQKSDRIRHTEIIKRVTEVVLREKDTLRLNTLLSVINSPFGGQDC